MKQQIAANGKKHKSIVLILMCSIDGFMAVCFSSSFLKRSRSRTIQSSIFNHLMRLLFAFYLSKAKLAKSPNRIYAHKHLKRFTVSDQFNKTNRKQKQRENTQTVTMTKWSHFSWEPFKSKSDTNETVHVYMYIDLTSSKQNWKTERRHSISCCGFFFSKNEYEYSMRIFTSLSFLLNFLKLKRARSLFYWFVFFRLKFCNEIFRRLCVFVWKRNLSCGWNSTEILFTQRIQQSEIARNAYVSNDSNV